MTTSTLSAQRHQLPMEAIESFCLKWNVAEMSLFGSAVRSDFAPDSDVDVLVQYQPGKNLPEKIELVVDRGEALSSVFGQEADMVDMDALRESRNWLLRKRILEEAVKIYG